MSEMKKGDLIQKRKEVKKGDALWHNLKSIEEAERQIPKLTDHYNLPNEALFEGGYDPLNSGMFAILALSDTYVTLEARVQWVVDMEASIQHTDSGGYSIIDLTEEKDWVVIEAAAPTYQSDVEHMSDEELRASIDNLRGQRLVRPVSKKKVSVKKAPPMSAEDKKLTGVLNKMSPEEKLELQRKLGLVD